MSPSIRRVSFLILMSSAILMASTGGALQGETPQSSAAAQALGEFVAFPACGVSVRQPKGFAKAEAFEGFGDSATQSSVVVVCLQGPYSMITAGFTKEHLAARGWTLHSHEAIEVDDRPAILVHFEQPAGGKVFSKWLLAFGDEKKTTLVTASFPQNVAEKYSARLKAALLSTRVGAASAPPGMGTELPFSVDLSTKLKRSPGLNNTLIYTKDGVMPLKSPADPLFILAPALSDVTAGDKRQFAEQRLRATAHTTDLTIQSTAAVTIAGIDGYESLAEAQDATSKAPILVYQVILFDGGSYILMQGLVGAELGAEYLPEFKAMSRSFKKRP